MTGVTLKLLKTTYENSSDGETEIKVNVEQNTDELVDAINSFISAYNAVISEVSTDTGKNGSLSSENTLSRMASSLRATATSSVAGIGNDSYNCLALIGVTTGKIGATDKTSGSLTLDKDVLLDALSDNPSMVKAMLIGDDELGITGVMEKLKDQLDSALDVTDGYFVTRDDTFDSQVEDIENSISKKTAQLEAYQSRLTKQFTAMDQYISELQSSSSYLSS